MHLTKAYVGFAVCTCTSKYVHLSLQLRVDSDWARRVKASMSHLNTNSNHFLSVYFFFDAFLCHACPA